MTADLAYEAAVDAWLAGGVEHVEDHARAEWCPCCAGDGLLLGQLGRLTWFRCRYCGIDFNRQEDTMPDPYTDDDALALLDALRRYYSATDFDPLDPTQVRVSELAGDLLDSLPRGHVTDDYSVLRPDSLTYRTLLDVDD